MANFMYVNDAGKILPYRIGADLWMSGLILNYANVDQVRLCPIAPYTPKKPSGSAATAWVWGSELRPGTREPRWSGSYALNGWMYSGDWPDAQGLFPSVKNAFRTEDDITGHPRPGLPTPCGWTLGRRRRTNPRAIFTKAIPVRAPACRESLARHGSVWVVSENLSKLPAAINHVFTDGHASRFRLNTRTLAWHKNWVPDKRRMRFVESGGETGIEPATQGF